jgi:C-terminal processing protease CtpA/Prc
VNELKRILRLLPQEGLIIDVRGNPGGMVQTGERLLQLFTPRFIQPENFHMICTPLTLELSKASSHLKPWIDSVEQGFETGSAFSQGFTLTPEDVGNREGQIYQGPVLLITNALCYSTTDMFAGGFADHEIGEILGTSGDTGAGGRMSGATPTWRAAGRPKFPALPRGAQMTVALRRSTRVGDHSGVPVEDLGVVPTLANRLTKIAAEARKPGQG